MDGLRASRVDDMLDLIESRTMKKAEEEALAKAKSPEERALALALNYQSRLIMAGYSGMELEDAQDLCIRAARRLEVSVGNSKTPAQSVRTRRAKERRE